MRNRIFPGGHVDVRVLGPGGKQIHATQEVNGEWRCDTYVYEEEGDCGPFFYFEQHSNSGDKLLFIPKDQLREHVVKLLPRLFTAEELRNLLAKTAAPGGA